MRYLVRRPDGTFPYYAVHEVRDAVNRSEVSLDWLAKAEEGTHWITVEQLLRKAGLAANQEFSKAADSAFKTLDRPNRDDPSPELLRSAVSSTCEQKEAFSESSPHHAEFHSQVKCQPRKLVDPLYAIRKHFLLIAVIMCYGHGTLVGYRIYEKWLSNKISEDARNEGPSFDSLSESETHQVARQRPNEPKKSNIKQFIKGVLAAAVFGLGYVPVALVFGSPVLWIFWRQLPNKETNAFYLRSFRNDPSTLPVRKLIGRALGRKRFRLSGIRDPRCKVSPFLRGMSVFAFALRYSSLKYMNLEAGDDWRPRLVRSLAEARCVFIDVTDLTDFVCDEVGLCIRCLGLQRILFIVDASHDSESWRRIIAKVAAAELRAADPEQIRIAIWEPFRPEPQLFMDAVRAFAGALPDGVEGFKEDVVASIPNVEKLVDAGRSYEAGIWDGLQAGIAAPYLISAFLMIFGIDFVFEVLLSSSFAHSEGVPRAARPGILPRSFVGM